VESIPSRVVTSPRLPDASRVGSGSREVSRPFDDITRASPMCGGSSTPAAVSLSGLSQPLSDLPAHPSFAALFHAADRPWGSPFRALLLARVAARSRARSAPLRFSAAVPEVRCSRSHPPGSGPTPTPARGSPALPRSSVVVSVALSRGFLDGLDPAHRDHPVPAASSASKPSSPRESVRPDRRLPGDREPMLSWGSAPPEPCSDRASGPRVTRRTVPFAAELAPRRREGLPLARRVRWLRPHGRVHLVGARPRGATARPERAASRRHPCLPRPSSRPLVSGRD